MTKIVPPIEPAVSVLQALITRCEHQARSSRVEALGIVTRMGRNPQGFGGEAIEPGPAGKRPHSAFNDFGADMCTGCLYACRTDQAGCVERFQDLTDTVILDGVEVSAAGESGRACATRRDRRAAPLGNTGTTTVECAR